MASRPPRRRNSGAAVVSTTAAMTHGQFGDFQLIEKVERGGPADLYRALWLRAASPDERRCLLKRLRPDFNDSPIFRHMFADEARVLSSLDHQNIVRVLAHGEVGGQPFLALEPLDGLSLAHLCDDLGKVGKKLEVELAAFIAREIAVALAHAHGGAIARGAPTPILHRDLRPSNIMLLQDGRVKLFDFGVARMSSFVSGRSSSAGGAGRACYRSPEEMEGLPLDPRSDLYALGVILWELLVGRPLFPATIARTPTTPIPRPCSERSEIPEALDELVMSLLAWEPGARRGHAGLFACELEPFLPTPADAARALGSVMRGQATPLLAGTAMPMRQRPPVGRVPGGVKVGSQLIALGEKIPGAFRRVTSVLGVVAARAKEEISRPIPAVSPLSSTPVLGRTPGRLSAVMVAAVMFVGGIVWNQMPVEAEAIAAAPRPSLAMTRLGNAIPMQTVRSRPVVPESPAGTPIDGSGTPPVLPVPSAPSTTPNPGAPVVAEAKGSSRLSLRKRSRLKRRGTLRRRAAAAASVGKRMAPATVVKSRRISRSR